MLYVFLIGIYTGRHISLQTFIRESTSRFASHCLNLSRDLLNSATSRSPSTYNIIRNRPARTDAWYLLSSSTVPEPADVVLPDLGDDRLACGILHPLWLAKSRLQCCQHVHVLPLIGQVNRR